MFNFIEMMNHNLPFGQVVSFCIRIIVASFCGALLGLERSKRLKEAGIRTHIVVACTAAVLMIVSKYCFADLGNDSDGFFYGVRGADPARIAAQVVSGVSFLGAGVIFKNGASIKGITTAAGIWATSAIGLAIGSGMYLIGIFTTILIVVIQFLTHKFTVGVDSFKVFDIVITVMDNLDFSSVLDKKLEDWHAQIIEGKVEREENQIEYHFTIRMPKDIDVGENYSIVNLYPGIKMFEFNTKY